MQQVIQASEALQLLSRGKSAVPWTESLLLPQSPRPERPHREGSQHCERGAAAQNCQLGKEHCAPYMSSARMGSEAAALGQGNNWIHTDTHMCEALTVPRDLGSSSAQPRPAIRCLPSPLHGLPERLPWGEPGRAWLSRGRTRRRTSTAPGPGKGPTGHSEPAGFDLQRCCCSPQRTAIAAPPRDRPRSKPLSLCITGFCSPASRCPQHVSPPHLEMHPSISPLPAQHMPSAPSPGQGCR